MVNASFPAGFPMVILEGLLERPLLWLTAIARVMRRLNRLALIRLPQSSRIGAHL
jgi:hypothetical protein